MNDESTYQIVERNNPFALHSCGYWGEDGRTRAQARIDSGDALFAWMNREAQFVVVRDSAPRLPWSLIPAQPNVAALSVAGDYVISHRRKLFTVSYRPTGQHIHVAQCERLDMAKRAAEYHADLLTIPA